MRPLLRSAKPGLSRQRPCPARGRDSDRDRGRAGAGPAPSRHLPRFLPAPPVDVSLAFNSRVARWRRRWDVGICCCCRCRCCCRLWPPRCWARPRRWDRYRRGQPTACPATATFPVRVLSLPRPLSLSLPLSLFLSLSLPLPLPLSRSLTRVSRTPPRVDRACPLPLLVVCVGFDVPYLTGLRGEIVSSVQRRCVYNVFSGLSAYISMVQCRRSIFAPSLLLNRTKKMGLIYWCISINTQGIVLSVFLFQYLCCSLLTSVLNSVAF